MEPLEVSIEGELFRISERQQPSGAASYDFAWLNGPADGTYGFTIGIATSDPHTAQPGHSPKMSKKELVTEAQNFVDSFYEVGGTGAEDFPDHRPARFR